MTEFDDEPSGNPPWRWELNEMAAFERAIYDIRGSVQQYEALEQLRNSSPADTFLAHSNPEINTYLHEHKGTEIYHLTPASTNCPLTNRPTRQIHQNYQNQAPELERHVRHQ
jgi:hypothetical protein